MNRLKRTDKFFNSVQTPRMLSGVSLCLCWGRFLLDLTDVTSATPPRKVGKKSPAQNNFKFHSLTKFQYLRAFDISCVIWLPWSKNGDAHTGVTWFKMVPAMQTKDKKKNLVKRSPWGSQENRVQQVSQNKELRSPYVERNDWLFLCYFENLFLLKQQLFNKQNMHCIMHKRIPSNWKSCKMQFIMDMQIKKMVIFLLLVKYSLPLTYMFV